MVLDTLLPDLLKLPPGTDLHDHPLVEEGVLILQVGGGGREGADGGRSAHLSVGGEGGV